MTRKYLQNGNIYKFGVLNVHICKGFIIIKLLNKKLKYFYYNVII